MIVGHIGARKGSRGVPGKNMKQICGRPLIDWSLDCLFESEFIDHVVVSSDCEDIYAHGLARGNAADRTAARSACHRCRGEVGCLAALAGRGRRTSRSVFNSL